jgi:hypothetical protein
VRTCHQLLHQKQALWTFLESPGIEPTNNAAERCGRRAFGHGWVAIPPTSTDADSAGQGDCDTPWISPGGRGCDELASFITTIWFASKSGGYDEQVLHLILVMMYVERAHLIVPIGKELEIHALAASPQEHDKLEVYSGTKALEQYGITVEGSGASASGSLKGTITTYDYKAAYDVYYHTANRLTTGLSATRKIPLKVS